MPLHVRIEPDLVILSNLGRLMNDPRYTSAGLEIQELLDEGHRRFILELRDVREPGEPLLGVLLTLTRRIQRAGGDVVLAHPSRAVVELLDTMGLDDFWYVFGNIGEAEAFYRRG